MHDRQIIFSAPSGAGKTTIVHRVLAELPELTFSVSCTTREPREKEQHGRDYYFLKKADFVAKVGAGLFVEWEEVYAGTLYGTLKEELARIHGMGKFPVFEVDVKGGLKLKEIFGADALAIFIQPPSIEVLQERLQNRGTESAEEVARRIARSSEELSHANQFDRVVVNEVLDVAVAECVALIRAFLQL